MSHPSRPPLLALLPAPTDPPPPTPRSIQPRRLTSQEAQNLISLYEVAAVQELELSDQLDMLWNLKPASGMMPGANPEAPNSWRMWLQDHHNADIYCPLKVLAEAVPAVDQQYGFVSVTRNSLVLSLGFLKVSELPTAPPPHTHSHTTVSSLHLTHSLSKLTHVFSFVSLSFCPSVCLSLGVEVRLASALVRQVHD